MFPLFKKELTSFLGSITGYLIIVIFLLFVGLFLWVFPETGFNILEGGYATLNPLFSLAPWLFIFLIPGITMRLFSEEIRVGTIELLYTKPLTEWAIIGSKFLAAFCICLFSILPTFIYFIALFYMGDTVGNIDVPGTLGSYLGLLFLISGFVSIGIFASSITNNQIVSFIIAAFLSFTCYVGFESIGLIGGLQQHLFLVKKIGMINHYQSMSRGVLDTRDLIYFISFSYLFLYMTKLTIAKRK